MDREIDPTFRRRQFVRRALVAVLTIACLITAFIWLPRWLKPTLARAQVRLARVESGPLEATITSSGTVVPEIEQVLSSPVNARVLRILKRPGAVLSKGEPILELDLNESRLAIEKLNQQVELKQNQQAKVKLDLENTLIDQRSRWQIKQLEYKTAKATTARNRTLNKEGLLSEERLREVELVEEKTQFELKQIEEAQRNAQQSTQTQLEGLALEMKTLKREQEEAVRQMELATAKADRAGVLTWVINEEGATVQKGALLARIADLSSFRVEANVSDVHASRLAAGLPVKVKLNETTMLDGEVARINPTVTNGVITLVVNLADKANTQLRSNLRVDVFIVTDRKAKVLRVRKGPFASGEGLRDVFVVRGDVAVKTPVRFGIVGAEDYEVTQGLFEGDEVIISDMTEYMHVKEVKLK